MLSTNLHQYPPAFGHVPPPNAIEHQHHHHQLAAEHMGHSSLESLAQSSQYAALQFHHNRHVLPNGKGVVKPHRLPYASGPLAPRHQREMLHERSGRSNSTSGPVRRRISRACDQCNQLRTKCDGRQSCAHCIEFGLTCEYIRERKKRGKASRKDIAQQQAAAAAAAAAAGNSALKSEESNTPQPSDKVAESIPSSSPKLPEGQRSLSELPPRSASTVTTRSDMDAAPMYPNRTMSLNTIDPIPESDIHHQMGSGMQPIQPMQPPRIQTHGLPMQHSIPEYTSIEYHRNLPYQSPLQVMQPGMHPVVPSHGHAIEYSDSPYSMMSPQSAHAQGQPSNFGLPEEHPNMGYMAQSPVDGSPGWILPSPSTTMYSGPPQQNHSQQLRYPVLQPLVPHLANIMPVSLACDLLEVYFQSSSSAFMQPVSPYVLGYVFRKRSFLRSSNPRVCSPALLASMLWIGCLTSESPYLSSSPSARSQLSEKLINLTIGLLKPLVHQTPGSPDNGSANFATGNMVDSGVTMDGFGMPPQESEIGLPGASGGLDEVATYMHLAIVISASEYKAASLRWWNAAWSLARELKLGKEVPVTPPPEPNDEGMPRDIRTEHTGGAYSTGQHSPVNYTEEQREERRRIWWLLFTVDRHLALCYNRPLSLLDVECSGLLQPLDDNVWQSGEFFEDSAQSFSDHTFRRRGPAFECTGHSIFGFFLPLMTILGEITDLYHARNHPRFGAKTDWEHHVVEISQQLVAYGHSLQELRNRAVHEANVEAQQEAVRPSTPSVRSANSSMSRAQENLMHAKIVEAYGTHLMHTLHILLNGKWDPIALLDDNDLWISSQSFVDATGHAVHAAEALNEVLELDPDLSFMPFFFGIYLLQGSFLLLLIADKLQGDANPKIVRACEVIVRAHEACIVTLNTEYQRNFRKVMRSALQQVRGRGMDEHAELAQQRRREMLSLYRWSGDGTGLAL